MSDFVLSVCHVVCAFVALILVVLVLVIGWHPPQAITESVALFALAYALIASRLSLKGGGR